MNEMIRYIALLRAINVGRRTVKMDQLRATFEALDFARVSTFIASGNVIFESPEPDSALLESRIEAALAQDLGFEVDTFLRAATDLRTIADHDPFDGAAAVIEGARLYVAFLKRAPSGDKSTAIHSLSSDRDDLAVNAREIYWLSRTSLSESAVSGALLEKTLGAPTTVRNMNTVRRLVAKYGDS